MADELIPTELGTESTGKLLKKYAVPAIIAMTASSLYNMIDSIFIGHGVGALAISGLAVTFPLMNLSAAFGTLVGVGASTMLSVLLGQKNYEAANKVLGNIASLNVIIGILFMGVSLIFLDPILYFFGASENTIVYAREYMQIILAGNAITHLYLGLNNAMRASGNPKLAMNLTITTVFLNVILAPLFIFSFKWGIRGAAAATVIAQGAAALGIVIYTYRKRPELKIRRNEIYLDRATLKEITEFSTLTCVQQSVMNLGILMVQGLVNSFGTVVMAAFAAAVKIDAFAYMPVQEFGNAFSTFVAQNFGARKRQRIRRGIRQALLITCLFSLAVSLLIFLFAEPLMLIFVKPDEVEILRIGAQYLRIEGAFYALIGILFLLYGYYRSVRMPGMSVILTVLSLGSRVALSYILASLPAVGVTGIWWSIPIGWFIADLVGIVYYKLSSARVGRLMG